MWQGQLYTAETAIQHALILVEKALIKPTSKSTITSNFRKLFLSPSLKAFLLEYSHVTKERIQNLSQTLEKSIETFTFA